MTKSYLQKLSTGNLQAGLHIFRQSELAASSELANCKHVILALSPASKGGTRLTWGMTPPGGRESASFLTWRQNDPYYKKVGKKVKSRLNWLYIQKI